MGPSLDELRERAELRRAASLGKSPAGGAAVGLRRNNTVDGVGLGAVGRMGKPEERQLDRAEARVNLMRKLSGRRLESPAPSSLLNQQQQHQPVSVPLPHPLAVVGKRGKARPRSGSVGDYNLGLGGGAGEFLKERERDWRREVRRGTEEPVPRNLDIAFEASADENLDERAGRRVGGGSLSRLGRGDGNRGGEGNFSFHAPGTETFGSGLQVPLFEGGGIGDSRTSLSVGNTPLRRSREFGEPEDGVGSEDGYDGSAQDESKELSDFLPSQPDFLFTKARLGNAGRNDTMLLETNLQEPRSNVMGIGSTTKLYPFLPPAEGYQFPGPSTTKVSFCSEFFTDWVIVVDVFSIVTEQTEKHSAHARDSMDFSQPKGAATLVIHLHPYRALTDRVP